MMQGVIVTTAQATSGRRGGCVFLGRMHGLQSLKKYMEIALGIQESVNKDKELLWGKNINKNRGWSGEEGKR